MNSIRKHAKKKRLFKEQNGLCHWCQGLMVLKWDHSQYKKTPVDLATFEHLDDRYSPLRGKFTGLIRVVLAHWKCNQERNIQREIELGIQVVKTRSKLRGAHKCKSI